MPVIKAVPHGGVITTRHVLQSVEVSVIGGARRWKARYMSYVGDAQTPTTSGTIQDVPIRAFGDDIIAAFEQACVETPASALYGGIHVPHGAAGDLVEIERAAAWAKVKVARDAYLDAGVATPYGVFDSDLVSIVNILGAAAATPEGATVQWILKDSSTAVLTKAQIVEVGALLAASRSAAYTCGAGLRAQIDAAMTAEDARAIVWTPPA